MQTYTIVSYVALGALAFFLYRHYAGSTKTPVRVPDHKAQPVRKEPKAKKPREKKPPAPADPKPAAATTSYQPIGDSSDDDKINNKEFARQLTLAKTGTKVTTKKADDKKIKSVKQSRAQEKVPEVEKASAPSSTAGIDADDDQSAEPSPIVAAADAAGVADMLEAPASGPKSIRLTDTVKEDTKPKSAPKAPEPALTKKQRQNKKKAELKKLEREEEEKERKALMEAQRRQARIAEGRPAKDGTVFTNQATSAWTKEKTNGSSASAMAAPLDTFDAPKAEPKESSGASMASDWADGRLPSEEEQTELAIQETREDEWATVETKASRRKQNRKQDDDTAPKSATKPNGSTATAKAFTSQSAFAALNTGGDSTEESEESDAQGDQTTASGKSIPKAVAPKTRAVEVEWDI